MMFCSQFVIAVYQAAAVAKQLRQKPGMRSEERRVGKECRSRCDWSSDVCSSDLDCRGLVDGDDVLLAVRHRRLPGRGSRETAPAKARNEIGRASCRERV